MNLVHEDIYFDHKSDAELVFATMQERLDKYDKVTLGDMRHMSGLSANPTHQRYGWTDLSKSKVVQTNVGWMIEGPNPHYYK